MEKAPDAFRTISEVADDLDVPQHVLRFWESRFTQIRPMKRGGGRRYYRPDDVALLRGVRHLLYGQGYTIRGVQRILREQGIQFVQSVWQAGAEQPERLDEEDTAPPGRYQDPESPPPERREPVFEARTIHIPRAEPDVGRLQTVDADLAAADRQALRVVLDELAECRRLLDAALEESA